LKVYNSVEETSPISNPVVTIGMYDGVHVGHKKIIDLLNKEAIKVGGESVLLTFKPHPRLVLQENPDLKLLTLEKRKLSLLKKSGLKNIVFQPFTKSFSRITSLNFVRDILVGKLNIHTLIVGHDHHFGRNRQGDYKQLLELSELYGFCLKQLPAVTSDDVVVSSTKVRDLLLGGKIALANKALGENFAFSGVVIEGDRIGRTIGFPTANMLLKEHQLCPLDGVYKVNASVRGEVYLAMLNIGNRPTVGGDSKRIEVHILNFDENIYGENIEVVFLKRIRAEIKFKSIHDLKKQLEIDRDSVINEKG
jgi:riboflavin kinase/FMN adenylyltransferase